MSAQDSNIDEMRGQYCQDYPPNDVSTWTSSSWATQGQGNGASLPATCQSAVDGTNCFSGQYYNNGSVNMQQQTDYLNSGFSGPNHRPHTDPQIQQGWLPTGGNQRPEHCPYYEPY